MAYITLPSRGRGYQLHLDLAQVSQSIPLNQSTVSWSLYITKGSGFGAYTGYTCYWSSTGSSGSIGGYNFGGYSTLSLGSGTFVVNHNPDGTGTANTSGSFSESDPDPELGNGTVYASLALTTIPRATQPTVSPTSGETGTTFTIGHTPASSAFYHDVAYSIDGGSTYTDIVTNLAGTDTSTDWTPAHSLLPNATSATAIIRVITYDSSGGSVIGTKTVNLPLTVPASVKPTVSSVSWEDSQTSAPDMPTLMGGAGRFVQGWSRLKPTVTSAGAGGSTVTGSTVTVNGRTTDSGTAFATPVALSGSVPFTAVAMDSRARNSDTYSNTVPVAAYNPPNLPTPLVVRTSDAGGGTPSATGTYLAITPAASVSSLLFAGSEKNLLEWRIRIKPLGGSYTTVSDWSSATVSGNTWTTKYVAAGPYLSSLEYIVEVSVRDVFGKNGYNTGSTVKTLEVSVPSESVAFDWDAGEGLGINKYRQAGKALDVSGDVNLDDDLAVGGAVSATTITQGGQAVIDAGDIATTSVAGIAELATDAETIAGTDKGRVVTPAGLEAAYGTRMGDAESAITALETRPQGVIPSSVVVGSGSASVATDGTVTLSGCSSVSLRDVFDGLGAGRYLAYYDLTGSVANNTVARLAVGASVDATAYAHHYNWFYGSFAATTAMDSGGSAADSGLTISPGGGAAGRVTGVLDLDRPDKAVHASMRADFRGLIGGWVVGWDSGVHQVATAYDSLVLVASAGTFSGTIKVVKIA